MQIPTILLTLLLTATAQSACVAVASSASTTSTAASVVSTSTTTTNTTASVSSTDFGTCSPAMDFQLGRAGRKATEGTFLPTDPVVAKGQQNALNPNIITNRICDQLTNVCAASQAGKDACLSAKAMIAALGTKDASTADAWNQALGV